MSNNKGNFYSGTSNVVLPVPNKQAYPEAFKDKSRLTYYSSLFNSVEINSTFYKLPLARTVERWTQETEDNFRFTFKLWQGITHTKGDPFLSEDLARFIHIINYAQNKKGALLIQFPPSVSRNPILLHRLLTEIKLAAPDAQWPIAIEFRHRSWYTDQIYEMLEQHGAAMVWHDLPASAAPIQVSNVDLIYLRFHGPEGGYRGSYTDDFLSEYATYITDWLSEGKTVYTYFNNTMGAAVQNLVTLNKLVNSCC
ncbi:DUF72 domain-containing protein [Mucilaginibacter sp. CSA2-8R]|uniref:DUF72 domain-containing protein n=1 Tax=Mucilaginibacter sp. CSA2-8R TaxID=3141542 RepID=UPI00315DA036